MKLIYHFILMLTLESCQFSQESISLVRDDGSANFAYFCPYQNFCTSNASKTTFDKEMSSCCQRCSCSHDCQATGTCCPDMVGITNKEPKYPCQDMYELGRIGDPDLSLGASGKLFRVIDDCPNDELSLQFSRCTNLSVLEDFVLVTDSNQVHTYRNADCALCNGEKQYTHWDLVIKGCNKIAYQTFTTFEKRNEYILQHCFLYSKPPSGMEPLSRCYKKTVLVSSCSKALPTNVNVSILHDLCNRDYSNQNTAFFLRTDKLTVREVYSNVFCYLCRQGFDNMKDLCVRENFDSTKGIVASFSAIVAVMDTYSAVKDVEDKCPSATINDLHTKQCRPFFCPVGQIAVFKRCMAVFASSEEATFILSFEITLHTESRSLLPETGEPDIWGLFPKIGRQVFSMIRVMMKQQNFSCGLCDSLLFDNRNDSILKFSFEMQIYTSKDCSYHELVKLARMFVSKGKIYSEVKINGTAVRINFVLSTDLDRYGSIEFKPHVFGFYYDRWCRDTLTFTAEMLLDCPFFALNPDEIKKQTTTGKIDLVNNIVAHNLSVHYMCVDNYFSMWSGSNTVTFFQICFIFQISMLLICKLF